MNTNKLIGLAKKNNFSSFGSKKTSVQDIVKQSSKAICGITEREVIAPKGKSKEFIKKLRKAGFFVVGTSMEKPKKIWFIRAGGL